VTYRRFEELPVWNDAIELAVRTVKLAATGRLDGFADLRRQLERAAFSVSNNIAEGFERGTHAELLTLLYIARGSAGEVRSMLHLRSRLKMTDESDAGVADLRTRVEAISKQLGRWIESIKDSPIQGQRAHNAKTRASAEATRKRDDFLARLKTIRNQPPVPDEPTNHGGSAGD
jgi:four helix bundle protein